MTHWRSANPVRLSLAAEFGGEIDGAWWPRVDRMTLELPGLIQALTPSLGDITSINVNWPHLQRPPDFNWPGWETKPQHVITVNGDKARVSLLIVAYTTHSGLALMVLRRAAGLNIVPADRDKPAFVTAGSILQAALKQRAGVASGAAERAVVAEVVRRRFGVALQTGSLVERGADRRE